MKREEIIKALRVYAREAEYNEEYEPMSEFEDAAAMLESDAAEIAALKAYEDTGLAPEQVKAQKWISVKDRLPIQNFYNSSGDCLIAIKYAYDLPDEERSLCSGYLLDGEWWSYGDHSCHKIGDKNTNDEGDVVTHWMPLPEPPKEAQK